MTTRLITLAVAATLLAGCGDDSGGSGGSGGGKPPQQVVDAGDAAKGKQVFADNCAACHGGDGGGGTGPQLRGQDQYTDAETVVDQVRGGGGGMPAFGDRLSEQELADVSAFVTKDLAAK
jgi:mono/diheme cytochrome c family protein